MKKICLECYTIEELANELRSLIPNLNTQPVQEGFQVTEKILSRNEAAKYLKISLPTLNVWTKQERVRSYRIGSRVYYKEGELIASLTVIDHQKYKQGVNTISNN